jgi:uncharacterized protein (TIGR00255 family)
MILSMTGYGKAVTEYGSKKISVELRSLNSKQLDLMVRIPNFYKECEVDLRNEITRRVMRGKTELNISVEELHPEKSATLNKTLVKTYYEQMKEIADELNIETTENLFVAALRMPDTLNTEASVLEEGEVKALIACLDKGLQAFESFRKQEGEALAKDLMKRNDLIKNILSEIGPFEVARIGRIRERIGNNLIEFIGKEGIDTNRLEQEIIFYLEKLDITEEKVRLANHCRYFDETVKEEQPGRKLSFIAQEMGREINTIGSKSNDYEMQRRVVMMKDELEKIKEQLNNVL